MQSVTQIMICDFHSSIEYTKDVSNLGNDIVIVCGYFRKLIRGVVQEGGKREAT